MRCCNGWYLSSISRRCAYFWAGCRREVEFKLSLVVTARLETYAWGARKDDMRGQVDLGGKGGRIAPRRST